MKKMKDEGRFQSRSLLSNEVGDQTARVKNNGQTWRGNGNSLPIREDRLLLPTALPTGMGDRDSIILLLELNPISAAPVEG